MENAIQDLVLLSKRASLRRQRLGILTKDLASQLGISYTTLKNWETALPHRRVPHAELRWEDALKVPRGWLRNPEMVDDAPVALANNDTIDLSDLGLTTVAEEILAVAAWLSRRLENARTFDASLLTALEARRAGMFASRYGVWGTDRTTLNAIANEHKLTRERIRKIIEPMVQRALGINFILPMHERIRQIALSTSPVSIGSFEADNRALLGPDLSFDDADRFAREICGYSLANIWEKTLRKSTNCILPIVGGADDANDHVQAVRDAGLQMMRICGAAHIKFVTGMVSQRLMAPVAIGAVRGSLGAIEGVEYLNSEKEWFWFGSAPRNFAVDAVRKMLQATGGSIDIEVLHEGLCRSRRLSHDYSPELSADVELPMHILNEILSRIPWLKKVHHNDYEIGMSHQVPNALTENEKAVIQTILELGGSATRQEIHKRLVKSDIISAPMLQVILGNAPFIRNQDPGVYVLRGVSVHS